MGVATIGYVFYGVLAAVAIGAIAVFYNVMKKASESDANKDALRRAVDALAEMRADAKIDLPRSTDDGIDRMRRINRE